MREITPVKRLSPISGEVNVMMLSIDPKDYAEWATGKLAQDAFPYLTPGEREFIITGITESEWNQLFGDDQ